MKKLTPYQRIVRNARKGLGVKLTADEVIAMSLDNAIEQRAALDDMNDEGTSDEEYFDPSDDSGCALCEVDPFRCIEHA